jgi:hypothetical protein
VREIVHIELLARTLIEMHNTGWVNGHPRRKIFPHFRELHKSHWFFPASKG